MKRTAVVSCAALILLILLGTLCSLYAERSVEKLQARTEEMEAAMGRGKWREALQERDETERLWTEKSGVMQTWIVHENADHVTLALKKLRVALSCENEGEAALILEELKEALAHIVHQDVPHLVNVF